MLVGTVKKQDKESFQISPTLSMLIQERNFLLSDVAIKLISAVESEIGSTGFTPRHAINRKSSSFPYDHRTLANRDSLGTGPREKILIGKHIFYSNLSLLDMLCEDLSK